MVTVSCRSSAGKGKFAGQRPTFYHCRDRSHHWICYQWCLSLFRWEILNVYSEDNGVDEPVAYDDRMDDDDDDTGASVSNGTERNDVTTTDDVDERHQRQSLTSSPPRHIDFSASPPSPRRPCVSVRAASSSPCSRTASPRPCRATASAPSYRTASLDVDVAPSTSVHAHWALTRATLSRLEVCGNETINGNSYNTILHKTQHYFIHPSIYFESDHQGPYTEAHKPHIHKHIKNKRKSTVQKKRERKWHEVHHVYYKLNCKTRWTRTIVLATQIHDTSFNTIHHCVTEDRNKSHVTMGFCVKTANKEHKM